MSILKWLLGKSEVKNESDFSIEFYPLTKRYYPKYKDKYMRIPLSTGIIELYNSDRFHLADYCNTELGADKVINLYKEQHFKENVIIIKK